VSAIPERATASGHSNIARVQSLFDRESARWDRRYAPGGSMAARVERFVATVAGLAEPGAHVLDFGCGAGHIARALAGSGFRVAGCDISPRMLDEAARAPGGGTVEWVRIEPSQQVQLPFADGRFQVVVSSSVFEYLDQPLAGFCEIRRVLQPGGWAIVTVPDERHAGRRAERGLAALVRLPLLSRLLRLTPWRDYVEYLLLSVNRLGIESWEALARRAGLAPEPSGPCAGPLALIRARREDPPAGTVAGRG
jgi:ubiquinone/menaquinone biosynthesis C-methylase UbiE